MIPASRANVISFALCLLVAPAPIPFKLRRSSEILAGKTGKQGLWCPRCNSLLGIEVPQSLKTRLRGCKENRADFLCPVSLSGNPGGDSLYSQGDCSLNTRSGETKLFCNSMITLCSPKVKCSCDIYTLRASVIFVRTAAGTSSSGMFSIS